MKKLMQRVEMVATHHADGIFDPVRFRVEDKEQERFVIYVDKVLHRYEVRTAGQRTVNFRCRSTVNSAYRLYELAYEPATCTWYLSKW